MNSSMQDGEAQICGQVSDSVRNFTGVAEVIRTYHLQDADGNVLGEGEGGASFKCITVHVKSEVQCYRN